MIEQYFDDFLSAGYAALSIRNAMMDLIRAASHNLSSNHPMTRTDWLSSCRLDDILSDEERMQRIEAIADPLAKSPERIVSKQETYQELYNALDKLSAREQKV